MESAVRKTHPPIRRHRDSRKETSIQIREKGEVTYLTFPFFDSMDWIRHGFSTRLGGVSTGAEASMNLGFSREVSRENVEENYRRMAEAIGFSVSDMVFSWQTHTNHIRKVTAGDRGKGFVRERDYQDVDGLITNEEGLVLVTSYADCVPLMVADPVHRAIGCAHSGWRGTMADIGGELIRAMISTYGTDPKDVKAVIGPSVCQDCYEVSRDVIDRCRERFPEELWPRLFVLTDPERDKYHLDLWACCRENFRLAGVPEENIALPDLCTSCNPELLFSHRAGKGRHGNMAAFMEIIA